MALPNFRKIGDKAVGKSIRRQGEKRIDNSIRSKAKTKALDSYKGDNHPMNDKWSPSGMDMLKSGGSKVVNWREAMKRK